MSEITLKAIEQLLDAKLEPIKTNMATKEQIVAVAEQIEELARMTKHGFDDVLERLDVRERMVRVETSLQRIAKELHISL
jgi:uncharacterized membrane protein